eukprot:TRINITY_DN17347_c0_g1_i1.p1 TRINITY_DN17347_c0_g1~~TRINITY_DN17347_c0_g1_i1.p1  ORF type:complete len:452 (+),score=154.15 TRINITY_DN17347_c0_g1_i1:91-1356(+)
MAKPQWPPELDGPSERILFPTVEGVVNLGIGAPDDAVLREVGRAVRQASAHRFSQPGGEWLMQYGPTRGSGEFRDALAQFLSSEDGYGEPVDRRRLLATAGATQGLHFVVTHFFSSGDTVFVEDPTYFLSITILRGLGLKVSPLPTSARGLDAAELRRRCAALPPAQPGRRYRALLYVVPVYSNPTGGSWDEAQMREVVRAAEDCGVLVLSDDVYQLLRYRGPRRRRLAAFDAGGRTVVSSSSFTKIFSPAMRVGWLEAGPALIDELARSPVAYSGGGFNHMQGAVMASVLQLGLQRKLLGGLREEYTRRVAAIAEALRHPTEGLPPGCRWEPPEGGYFIWAELPRGVDARALLPRCVEECRVAYAPGSNSSPSGESWTNCIRLSFCYYDGDTVLSAVRQLCGFLRGHAAAHPGAWRRSNL